MKRYKRKSPDSIFFDAVGRFSYHKILCSLSFSVLTSFPSSRLLPLVGLFSKPIILSNVDLPHPEGRHWPFSAVILNTKQLSTALSRYFKEKTKIFPKIFGDFKISLYLCILVIKEISGLTGFDGEMKWYVSMRRLVGYLLNPSEQKINWRK